MPQVFVVEKPALFLIQEVLAGFRKLANIQVRRPSLAAGNGILIIVNAPHDCPADAGVIIALCALVPGDGPDRAVAGLNLASGFRNHDSAGVCLLYTSPSPRDKRQSRMPSSA